MGRHNVCQAIDEDRVVVGCTASRNSLCPHLRSSHLSINVQEKSGETYFLQSTTPGEGEGNLKEKDNEINKRENVKEIVGFKENCRKEWKQRSKYSP
jgi:hypothetical protein